jgi:hypothetical protein
MNHSKQSSETGVKTPNTASEALHLKRLLQTKEMAWLRVLKEAQAKEQCRQL